MQGFTKAKTITRSDATGTFDFEIWTMDAPVPLKDSVRMQVTTNGGTTIVDDWGTHASVKGATKFAAARGFTVVEVN
tara:strand:+ start:330 stop:560 length:231 start_codon:yes stop_codon:yes gene_type:complete